MDEMGKLSLLEDDMGVYVESQMESTKKLLEVISELEGCRIQDQSTKKNTKNCTSIYWQ